RVLRNGSQLGQRRAEEVERRRRHAHGDPLAIDGAPDGVADHAEPDLRALGELLLHDLARHAERQLEQLALVPPAQPGAEGGELLERLDERLPDRLDVAAKLLAPELVAGLK